MVSFLTQKSGRQIANNNINDGTYKAAHCPHLRSAEPPSSSFKECKLCISHSSVAETFSMAHDTEDFFAGSSSSQPLPTRFLPTVIGSSDSQSSSGKAGGSAPCSQTAASQDFLLDSENAQDSDLVASEALPSLSGDGDYERGSILSLQVDDY